MNKKDKEMTQEEIDQDFKKMAADIFMSVIPDSYMDEDGFIVIPRKAIKKHRNSDQT